MCVRNNQILLVHAADLSILKATFFSFHPIRGFKNYNVKWYDYNNSNNNHFMALSPGTPG